MFYLGITSTLIQKACKKDSKDISFGILRLGSC